MLRPTISALVVTFGLSALVPLSTGPRVDEEAARIATTRMAEWLGPASPRVGTLPASGRWLNSRFDVSAGAEVARAIVRGYTDDLVSDGADGGGLRDELTTYLTGRLTEEIFASETVSTTGASFAIERYFGGYVPYAIRSIRLDRAQVGRADRLLTLERYLGWPVLQSALHEYYTRFEGRHASLDDFIRTANDVTGRRLEWLFDATGGETVSLDYGVRQVTVEPPGLTSTSQGLSPVEPQSGSRPFQGRRRTTVVVQRYGDAMFSGSNRPRLDGFESGRAVVVRVFFEDGAMRDERWDGRDRWTAFVYDSVPPVTAVVVDPERVMAADHHTTNNSWTRAPRAGAAADKWSARWMTWLEDAILGWAFFV